MFRLIESRGGARRQRGAALFSVVTHTTVVVAAVVSTAASEPTRDPDPRPPRPIYLPVPSDPAAPAPPPRTPEAPTPSPTTPVVVAPPTEIPTELPPVGDPTPSSPVIGAPIGTGDPVGPATSGPVNGFPLADTTAAWADQVDRAAIPLGRARAPRYPDILRSASREGSVVALFVVDTLGRVEPASFRTTSSTHALFTESVRGVVLAMRFQPAEVGGRPVRQLVEQRFVFALRR